MKAVYSFIPLVFFYLGTYSQSNRISEEEAIRAGKVLESAVFRGEPSAISHLIDENLFFERLKQKSEAAKEKSFMTGFRSSFRLSSLSDNSVSILKKGSYRLLRTYEKEGQRHLLFRAFGEQGINYHDFSLIKVNDSVKADDLFIFITGEDLTSTLASFIDATVNASKSIQELSANVSVVVRTKQLADSGDFIGVKKLIDNSEPGIQSSKAIQIRYLNACKNISDSAYKVAMLNYAKLHPDDATIYLKMIDFYFLQEDYPLAMKALNQLDSAVGGDPFLDYIRANIFYTQKRIEEAELLYKKLFDYDHGIGYSLIQVVHLYMRKGDSANAKHAIQQYRDSGYSKEEVLKSIYSDYPSLNE